MGALILQEGGAALDAVGAVAVNRVVEEKVLDVLTQGARLIARGSKIHRARESAPMRTIVNGLNRFGDFHMPNPSA